MNNKNCSTTALAVAAILVIGTLVAIIPVGDADAARGDSWKKFYDKYKAQKKSSVKKVSVVKDNTVIGGDGAPGGPGGEQWSC